MKVLLLKDVFKLGRAGDVKKVANGYGRNYLIPQGLAVLATPGALKQVEKIREEAAIRRAALNNELQGIADAINGLTLAFPVKAGEMGKLYGSITSQNIADALSEKISYEIKRQQIEMQPIRMLGEHSVKIRLTVDLIPEIKVIAYREGEPIPTAEELEAAAKAQEEAEAEAAALEEAPEEAETPEEAAPAEE